MPNKQPTFLALSLLALVLISGCTTKCNDSAFWQPTAINAATDVDYSSDQTSLRIQHASGLTIRVSNECGPLAPLCVEYIPEEGVSVRLMSKVVEVSDAGKAGYGKKLGETTIDVLKYSPTCFSKKPCTTSLDAVPGEINRRSSVHGNATYHFIEVDPSRDFRGAPDDSRGIVVPHYAKLRWYQARLQFPAPTDNEGVLIKLPPVSVNGKEFNPPVFKYKRTYGALCYATV